MKFRNYSLDHEDLVMRSFRIGVTGALWAAFVCLAAGQGTAQKPKDLQWTHAFDLSCRPYGKAEFEKDTPKFGVEAFRDNNNGLGLYISQTGSIAVGHGFQDLKLPLTSKGPDWLTGLDLPAQGRRQGVQEGNESPQHGDLPRSQYGQLDLHHREGEPGLDRRQRPPRPAQQGPKWVHSVDLPSARAAIRNGKNATKYGIEVYRDRNTGNLVYITEPARSPSSPKPKKPTRPKQSPPNGCTASTCLPQVRRAKLHQGHP